MLFRLMELHGCLKFLDGSWGARKYVMRMDKDFEVSSLLVAMICMALAFCFWERRKEHDMTCVDIFQNETLLVGRSR